MRITALVLASVLSLSTLAAAFGGYVDPLRNALPAVLSMCFPGFELLLIATVVLAWVFRFRSAAAVSTLALIVTLPVLFEYSPLNVIKPQPNPERPSFTVMTYNAYWWNDFRDEPLEEPNGSLEVVLKYHPDILVSQECGLIHRDESRVINREQADSLETLYPYHYTSRSNQGLSIYSRFPVTVEPDEVHMVGTGLYIKYRLSIEGHLLTLYNLHLQSIGLTVDERELYDQLIEDVNRERVKEAKAVLLTKLMEAYRLRSEQTREIRRLLDDTQGNVLVCGDFNDLPTSYALHTVMGDDFKSAYEEAGLGPGISFHAHHMYFRIDHILYRGDMRPIRCRVIREGVSDHYPVLATFEWTD